MSDSAALAVFVKTPGLSPIKTRLATSLGEAHAEEFYRRSLAAVEYCMTKLKRSERVHPYWAVAEADGLFNPLWRDHSTVSQGNGSLGDRLAHVFKELFKRHRIVFAIGGDSPQISVATLHAAIEQLHDQPQPAHVVGRCHDGGFYLVGSNDCLPARTWTQITYSADTTANELIELLAPSGPVHELGRLSDVDTSADLPILAGELKKLGKLTSPQSDLLSWIQDLLVR